MGQGEHFADELGNAATEQAGPVLLDRRRPGWERAVSPARPTALTAASDPEAEWSLSEDDSGSQPLRGFVLAVVFSLPLWALIAAICLI